MKTPDEIKKGLECCNGDSIACKFCPYNNYLGYGCTKLRNDDALAYIRQLEATQPKWISAKDRLPENGQMVFANTHYFYEVLQYDKKVQRWVGAYRSYLKNQVTHWMPLPEPPKEDE